MGIFEYGIYKEVHPAFLYESIITISIFILLYIFNKRVDSKKDNKRFYRKFSGETTLIYLGLYSFARFFIEWIRIDSLMIFNVRISQGLSLIVFVVSCYTMSNMFRKWKKTSQNDIK